LSVFDNYNTLLNKTDEKSKEITTRYADKIRCGKGCHSCCLHGLTVNGLERENIRRHLVSTPGLAEKAEVNAKANHHNGQRCSFLDADGACLIYEARPIVCRSHGVPLKTALESDPAVHISSSTAHLSVCPLNFTDLDLKDVGSHYFINLDTLNTILVLLNQQFDPKNAEKRVRLTPTDILGKSDS
jgi:Fe-S-cluster containining protein